MNGPILLLCCLEILGALMCGAAHGSVTTDDDIRNGTALNYTSATSVPDPTSAASSTSEASSLISTESLTTVSSRPTTSPSPATQSTVTTPSGTFYRKECLTVFIVTGGLIIACAILLISTLMLAWKVCQLSRRIKALSSNADLISNSEYWMGTAKKNKSNSETEAKETCMLMANVGQTQEEMGNGATKADGEKGDKDGQMAEENKKEVGDAAKSEEASATPVAVAENSSSTDSQPTKAVEASSSEGTEEPKDEV